MQALYSVMGCYCSQVPNIHNKRVAKWCKILTVSKGKDGEFSQTNWGNYEFTKGPSKDKKGPAKTKLKQHATIFQSHINSLLDEHWAAIMDGAHHYMGKKRSSIMKEEIREKTAGMSEEDNGMLVDPMFQ